MEGNHLLLRLKELESLEKIADKVEKFTVVGGLNALLERTVTLRAEWRVWTKKDDTTSNALQEKEIKSHKRLFEESAVG